MLRTFLLLFVMLPAPAFADIVGMPPDDCPPGSVPSSSHAGSHCNPSHCTWTGDCHGGGECVEQGLCVELVDGYSRGGPFQVENAVTTCSDDADCAPGALCLVEMRCVSRPTLLFGRDSPAVPLAVAALAVGVLLMLLIVVVIVVAVLVARRRKKARDAG